MNNRQPGRRRGRNTNSNNNNNRNQGNRGGADRDNRIDNRARGNAAQMLEKYKKMAQDAQVNGDRVNAEYYHQFADHYFRVNADTQARREEQRQARDEQRGPSSDRNENRDDNRRDSDEQEDGDNQDYSPRARQQSGQQNSQQSDRQNDRRPKVNTKTSDRDEDRRDEAVASDTDNGDDEAATVVEKKPVRARRPRQPVTAAADASPNKDRTEKAKPERAKTKATEANGDSNGFDVSVLPPAIAIQPDDSAGDESAEDDGEIKKKPAVRKRRTVKAKETQEGDAAA